MFFWQWTRDALRYPVYSHWWGNPSIGSVHNYKVSRYASDGNIHLLLDDGNAQCASDGTCGVTGFDPFVRWPDVRAEFHAETHYYESDMAGDANNHGVGNA